MLHVPRSKELTEFHLKNEGTGEMVNTMVIYVGNARKIT